jgi:hypothetical protein
MKYIFALAVLLSGIEHGFAACPSELADFRNIDDPRFVLSFSKQKDPKAWSGVMATLKTPHHNYAFEFTASNGYEVQSMVLLSKNIKQNSDITILTFDKAMHSLHLPQLGEESPSYLATPGLGSWLWYSAHQQDYLPPGLWHFEKCRK